MERHTAGREIVLDTETTGLDPKTADLLSVGWVLIRRGRVDLSTCETHLIRPDGEVEYAVTHDASTGWSVSSPTAA